MITLSINGEPRALDVDPATPLLWAIRDYAGLTGTNQNTVFTVRTPNVRTPRACLKNDLTRHLENRNRSGAF